MKRIFSLLFAAMLAGQAWAQTSFEVGNLKYTVTDETKHYVSVGKAETKPTGALNIPEKVTNPDNSAEYTVTSIGNYAFRSCSGLTAVTIPNSVTSIGGSAFAYCTGLTSVTIPNSVTSIGKYTFEGCSGLTSITIPNSVTSISNAAFYDCSGLTEINVESANTKYSSENGVLFNKNKTTIVRYPAGKAETEYTIPNSVTSIGNSAFHGCKKLTSVTIPNSVKTIDSYAFDGCSSLTSVTIPNSVTSIGDYAFCDCSGLTSVTIGNSVTSIGSFAFYGCSHLTSVTIPNSVTSIGRYAFDGCTGLTFICYEGSRQPTYQSNSFNNVNNTIPVYVPTDYASEKWCGFQVSKHNLVTIEATPATCTETGLSEGRSCTCCEKVLIPQNEIPALGHNYALTYAWAEDGSTCSATAICQRDESHTATENATITSAVTTAATCEGEGTTTYTATFENEPFSTQTKAIVDILATGHTAAEAVAENYAAPTCTAAGAVDSVVYCTTCKSELNRKTVEISATGHSYSNIVTPPTCTAVGYTKHTCSGCSYSYNSDTVAATGHTEAIDAAVAATCLKTGLSEGKHCSVCEAVIVAQDIIPALGHEFKTYTFDNNATTEADGTETATCEHGCGATDTRTAAGTKIATTPEKGTAVTETAANNVNIYAHGRTIVVENAQDEISVYDAMGRMVGRDAINRVRTEIRVNTAGLYIVKVGNVAKRVMVNN